MHLLLKLLMNFHCSGHNGIKIFMYRITPLGIIATAIFALNSPTDFNSGFFDDHVFRCRGNPFYFMMEAKLEPKVITRKRWR